MQIQQVLANLARNAMEAMENPQLPLRELTIVSGAAGDGVIIEVRDTGAGLADTASVFEPFFTTKRNGMGMGLAICKSIIEVHGGKLWATPAAPCGTTFSFLLPAADPVDARVHA